MARAPYRVWLVAAVLALVTLALYWPVTRYGFVNFDDRAYVVDNPHVRGGLTWENLNWAFTSLDVGLWHPLTWVSHMVDCDSFGLSPGWHHLTSLLLHAVNTVLLFLLLHSMTGALWRSALAAALFALHPLHVESVAWVAERKDVLSACFFLLTLWAYARYAECRMQNAECRMQTRCDPPRRSASEAGGATARRELEARGQRSEVSSQWSLFHLPSSIFYLLALAFFALGLMSKPMVVTLPLVLLLLDYWPLKRMQNAECRMKNEEAGDTSTLRSPPSAVLSTLRSTATEDEQHATRTTPYAPRLSRKSQIANRKSPILLPLLVEKLPFALMAALTCWITLYAGQGAGSLPSVTAYPMARRLANVALSYARYVGEVFWPGNLAVYYPFPATFPAWAVSGAVLLLLAISVLALGRARQWPYVAVGWLWYLAMLLPVIGLIQLATYSHADRYTYLPLVGVFIGLSWGVGELVGQWRRPALACAVVVVGAWLALCAARTRQQIGYWAESEILFRHALAVTKDNWLAHISLGDTLDRKGQTDEAMRQYQEALRLKPDNAEAHDNLGVILDKQGQIEEAIRHYQEALRFKPDDAIAHNNLGNIFLRKGQTDEAIRQYQEAVRLNPRYAVAHNNLGLVLARRGQTDEAIRQYQQALQLRPDFAQARVNLNYLIQLYRQGQPFHEKRDTTTDEHR